VIGQPHSGANPIPALALSPEPLIDCEEDRTLRAVLVGMLREGESPSRKSSVTGLMFRGPATGHTFQKSP